MGAESGLAEGGQTALPAAVAVGGLHLPVWPQAQATQNVGALQMAVTQFADFADYHPALVEATLAAARDPRFHDPTHLTLRASCGAKVRHPQDWDVPAATLVHARAMMLAQHALAQQPVFADDTWASIYGNGDYCMPHGHPRADVSVVYMLDPGDGDPADPLAGQLCFIDPRVEWCCPLEPGRVTRPLMPRMSAGTMLRVCRRVPAHRDALSRNAAPDHDVVEHRPRAPRRTGARLVGLPPARRVTQAFWNRSATARRTRASTARPPPLAAPPAARDPRAHARRRSGAPCAAAAGNRDTRRRPRRASDAGTRPSSPAMRSSAMLPALRVSVSCRCACAEHQVLHGELDVDHAAGVVLQVEQRRRIRMTGVHLAAHARRRRPRACARRAAIARIAIALALERGADLRITGRRSARASAPGAPTSTRARAGSVLKPRRLDASRPFAPSGRRRKSVS